MLMQNIRRATKNHRKALIIVVALLAVGLVSSFAVWNSDNYSRDSYADLSAAEKVEYYENYLAENAPASVEETDYGTATSIGGTYMTLYDLCGDAYYELYADEATQDQAAAYASRAQEAAGLAAEYYQHAVDIAPEELNNAARAQLITNLASALYYGGSVDQAGAYYAEADALSPNNANVVFPYANYLNSTQGYAAAETYLNAYMATLSEDDSNYGLAQQQLQWFQLYESMASGAETEGAGADTTDESDGGAAAE